ncbi:MAG: GMC family oxidoreductase [Myxococcales bacterium]|nr:GMC family oxidoreductase [Myxococcales bacterium]
MIPRLDAADARRIVLLAEAVTPAGQTVAAPDADLVNHVWAILLRIGSEAAGRYGTLLSALDVAAIPLAGRRLFDLPVELRTKTLKTLADCALSSALVLGTTAPLRLAQVTRGVVASGVGIDSASTQLCGTEEVARWHRRLIDARSLADGETLEVDVVVVGSGAGGAVVAHTLASRGQAVLILESGGWFKRTDFGGWPWERSLSMMRHYLTLGNGAILIPTGDTVGGSTTVNSGTCFRTPEAVLRRWRFEHGLTDLDPESLQPHFERVETRLGVAPSDRKALGQVAQVIARGAETLGWNCAPLLRNAPGCDGQGVCCFGCPTDAKRSTNVSYIPAAMEAGGQLIYHARVEEILVAGGRAVGVVARAGGASGHRLRVLARAVVLACGSLATPALLLKQGLANRSGQVGKNLTVHPAMNAWGRFDHPVDGWKGVPQGVGVDTFCDQGIRFEGGSVPLDIAAVTNLRIGAAWTRFVEEFRYYATFGFMIADSSRGRLVLGSGGRPRIHYYINEADRRRFVLGQSLLAKLFLAAGAGEVQLAIRGASPVYDIAGAERLRRETEGRFGAHRLELAGFHPLGTCRMGADPSRSVVDANHECHDISGLYVVDGAAVPGPLGVNPQVTIMALAERAGQRLAQRLEHGTPRRPRLSQPVHYKLPENGAALQFQETMSGHCVRLSDGTRCDVDFTLRVFSNDQDVFQKAVKHDQGGTLSLEGVVTVENLATEVHTTGTLTLRPRRRWGTLIYDLTWCGDDGATYFLHGEKNVSLFRPLTGMTTLYTEICGAAKVPLFRGQLRFKWADLPAFLATWRFRQKPSNLQP